MIKEIGKISLGPVIVALYWHQWIVGVLYDQCRYTPRRRWFVILLGPVTISIPFGRADR